MTTISAKMIADSISEEGHRLSTMELRYPRCIHSELMTHRQFSRNASSSRAIPVAKLIQSIIDDPFIPLFWGKNQKGMQASEECAEPVKIGCVTGPNEWAWTATMRRALECAEAFAKAGYHKQIVNRLLEPFAHITVVCSSTEWSNFFALRDHPDAEPHIRMLAQEMRKAMASSTPRLLKPGEWHLPYVQEIDGIKTPFALFTQSEWKHYCKLSAARCARTSYLTHDGKRPESADDLALFERLAGEQPIHASPLEHQATPDMAWFSHTVKRDVWQCPEQHGNFVGWKQFRKMLPGECQ